MSDVLFTSKATAEGGREGHVKSDDGIIDLDLVNPAKKQEGSGTNPEQLFAAGYSACFDGALNHVAQQANKDIDSSITAAVDFMKDSEDGGFKIGVTLNAEIKGVSQEEADELIQKAHDFCPYSKATKGNVDVKLNAKAV